ncbi:heat-shock protein Hsp20 [Nocardiopsis gilva YIM 90087]|uniref:Heat-shock protein Hsp20 n=1 Tax=Nocardiopsis gilva YIM 90087 TaxID=1235441 RepID=A0A223SD32_9ACTN|nr:Hsp20 family protein [Nocardiopsis gilva]ASU86064.1 heat-shock protein Hsp20 [Nocardiopsis gilva YIM 90087]
MMLMRTDPFREFDRMAQRLLGDTARPAAMPMDAYREDDTFVVHFDLPGVRADSIDLEVERDVLTVSATRDSAVQGKDPLVAERPSGVFSRQLFLGDALDTDNVTASYAEGVLTLHIPVAEQAKPRKISVTESSGPVAEIQA